MITKTLDITDAKNLACFFIEEGIPFSMKNVPTGEVKISFNQKHAAKVEEFSLAPKPATADAGKLHREIISLALRHGLGDPGRKDFFENAREACHRISARMAELEGTFEKATFIATELKKDLDWTRLLWGYDRTSLLENAGYWKKVVERLVENGIPKTLPFAEMRRPSERDLRDKTRETALDELARMARRGEVRFVAEDAVEERVEKKEVLGKSLE